VASRGKTIEESRLDIGGTFISTTHSVIPVKRPFQWLSIHPNPFLQHNMLVYVPRLAEMGRRVIGGALYRSAAAAAGRGGGGGGNVNGGGDGGIVVGRVLMLL
jgi:hypothetical protein